MECILRTFIFGITLKKQIYNVSVSQVNLLYSIVRFECVSVLLASLVNSTYNHLAFMPWNILYQINTHWIEYKRLQLVLIQKYKTYHD